MGKERDKFTEIYNQYYPLVFSAIRTKIEDIDDANDIMQEVFIRFYNQIDEVENPRKWLYGTLRNTVFEFYRKSKPDTNIDDVFSDMSLTFVNGFRDARIIIGEAFENMEHFNSDEEKSLFDLIAMHTFSYSQTAKQLGMTRRQVEYKYQQIVERILDYLKKQGIKGIDDLL